MLNDSWAGRNPPRFVVPLEEEEEECYAVTWVKLLHFWHTIVGETYFMVEELHEILQSRSNEANTENKHREGSNVEIDKKADETEESAIQGEDNGRKNRKLPLLHEQSIRLFHINLE